MNCMNCSIYNTFLNYFNVVSTNGSNYASVMTMHSFRTKNPFGNIDPTLYKHTRYDQKITIIFNIFKKNCFSFVNNYLIPFKVITLRSNALMTAFFPILKHFWNVFLVSALFRFFFYLLNRSKTEWLHFRFNAIAVRPWFVTSYDLFWAKSGSWLNVIKIYWVIFIRRCFCLRKAH